MKKHIILVLMTILCLPTSFAQSSIVKTEGNCGTDTKWSFDGYTLTISNVNKKGESVAIDDYDLKDSKNPWSKKMKIKKVMIGKGITRIGSCAFANCTELQEVVFAGTDMQSIGWGAFLNCTRLRNISLPIQLRNIETIAFANCTSLASVKIPDHCRVADQAYISCSNVKSLELSPTVILGHYVFANEVKIDNKVRHALYDGEIHRLPSYINTSNCHEFGLAKAAVEKITKGRVLDIDYDLKTSQVDSLIPTELYTRQDTYALIIGNQNYRFVSNVPYAIHDARVFGEYCQKTLGIPASNIHIAEDATKQMILEEELQDWMATIPEREYKKLIVYYAGHGVPDTKNQNKAYLLPTDVRGSSPQRGIALDDFYGKLGELAFNQTTVFLDACFSGTNRDNDGVETGLRAVGIKPKEATLGTGSIIVFSAAQGNETAQAYPEQGHGLFTYYLLKEIQESKGFITYGALAKSLMVNVSEKAKQLKQIQTPATNTSEQVANIWQGLRF